MKTGHKITTQK